MTTNSFNNEANDWIASNLKTGVKTSTCDTTLLLGGAGILGNVAHDSFGESFKRQYDGLPPHNTIRYSLTLWALDRWKYNVEDSDRIQFVFNDDLTTLIEGWIFDYSTFASNLCGDNQKDLKNVRVFGHFPHTSTTLKFKIISSLHYSNNIRDFGVRDVTFLTTSAVESATICADFPSTITFRNQNKCVCSEGQYKPPSDPCANCHENCKACFGPNADQCYVCKDGSYFDGTECKKCHSSCAACSGPEINKCLLCPATYIYFNGYCILDSKCSANSLVDSRVECSSTTCSGGFLFWDGNCDSSCDSPLVPDGQICTFPCPELKYVNSSSSLCQDTCDGASFLSVTSKDRKFCDFRCGPIQYWSSTTNSCHNSCPEGFYSNSLLRYCEACQASLCKSCSTGPTGNCNECLGGAIQDIDGICKGCDSLSVEYIETIATGHKYKLTLNPTSCDLDINLVKNDLQLTSNGGTSFPSFTFDVEDTIDPNIYIIKLYLGGSLSATTVLDATLKHLSGNLTVPYIPPPDPPKTPDDPVKPEEPDNPATPSGPTPSPVLQEIAEAVPTVQTTFVAVMGVSLVGTLALGASASLWSLVNFSQFVGYFLYINVEYPFHVEIFFKALQSSFWDILPNPLAPLTDGKLFVYC